MEIQVKDIAKSYGGLKAVDRITFDINRGEVYGIIGPNGAGKTTLMEIMLGLRRQDGGTVTIQGLDSARDRSTASGKRASGQYQGQRSGETAGGPVRRAD